MWTVDWAHAVIQTTELMKEISLNLIVTLWPVDDGVWHIEKCYFKVFELFVLVLFSIKYQF